MSAITVDGDLVHYEVLGRGRPVVLLHSWLGSWRYWIPLMRQLQMKYRVYAIDLYGYGDSSKNPKKYPIHEQIALLREFMKKMDITKAAMIGHGLGAQVMAYYALEEPERVARLLIVGAPLFDPGNLGNRVSPVMEQPAAKSDENDKNSKARAGKASMKPLASIVRDNASDDVLPTMHVEEQPPEIDQTISSVSRSTVRNPNMIDREVLRKARESAMARDTRVIEQVHVEDDDSDDESGNLFADDIYNPLRISLSGTLDSLLQRCFRRSEANYDMLYKDVARIDSSVIDISASGFEAGEMLDTLRRLQMPLIVVHGDTDPLIPAPSEPIWHYLLDDKEDRVLPIPLPDVRHYPMLEHEPFTRLVGQFLEAPDITKIEVKTRWVRRNR
jgi:pimeloyl-ACP methyl ester carboxylesterase